MSNEKKVNSREIVMEKWEKTRELGMIKYILFYGILQFGLPLGIFMSLFNLFVSQRPLLPQLAINVPLFVLGGIFYGFLTWKSRESMYKGYLKKKSISTTHDSDSKEDESANPTEEESLDGENISE